MLLHFCSFPYGHRGIITDTLTPNNAFSDKFSAVGYFSSKVDQLSFAMHNLELILNKAKHQHQGHLYRTLQGFFFFIWEMKSENMWNFDRQERKITTEVTP